MCITSGTHPALVSNTGSMNCTKHTQQAAAVSAVVADAAQPTCNLSTWTGVCSVTEGVGPLETTQHRLMNTDGAHWPKLAQQLGRVNMVAVHNLSTGERQSSTEQARQGYACTCSMHLVATCKLFAGSISSSTETAHLKQHCLHKSQLPAHSCAVKLAVRMLARLLAALWGW